MSPMMKQPSTHTSSTPRREQTFQITGMHCGSCVARLETGIKKALSQVEEVRVNLATEKAVVVGDVPEEAVIRSVKEIGYEAAPVTKAAGRSAQTRQDGNRTDNNQPDSSEAEKPDRVQAREKQARLRLIVAVALTIPLFTMHMAGWHFTGSGWVQFALSTPVLFYCGQDIFKGAFQLLKRFQSDMNTLIALGSGVAWGYSTYSLLTRPAGEATLYFETAAMIVTLILLGRYLEARARGKAGEAIRALMALQPPKALIQRNGDWTEVPVEEVPKGAILLVRPGSTIPLDGEVVEGTSSVNESMITGESLPVEKATGGTVIGGTLNESGSLQVRVTHTGEDSTLSRLIELVEKAQSGKPPIQKLADTVAGIFVPIVLVLAVITIAAWLLTGHPFLAGLQAAIAVLVIACPCALGLATPTAIQAGLGRAAGEGILIRDTEGLELAHRLTTLIMDKTGTLTEGHPTVIRFLKTGQTPEPDCVRLAAALEQHSEHPLGKAIVTFAKDQSVNTQSTAIEQFESETGAGIKGNIDGQPVLIGKPDYLQAQGIRLPSDDQAAHAASQQGQTPIYLAIGGQLAGIFLLADPLKPEAQQAIQDLRGLNIRPVMLSGDRAATAQAIGQQAGLKPDEIKGEVSPEDKQAFVQRLQQQTQGKQQTIGMVGDGINDAPALAQADVSIAIGTGTDVAMQTAQMTLVHGDIAKAVEAIRLSRRILRTIRQNLFLAFVYNVIAIPVAAFGLLNPMIAAAAMSLSSITVVLNSLRLRHTESR